VHFYIKITNYKKAITVKHNVFEGIKQRRIYYILERYESIGSSKFKPKTGRKRTVATPQVTKKVIKYFKNSNMSVREVVGKLKKSKTTVHNIKQRNGIKSNKRTVVPKYSEKQKKLAKTNCRKI
jgi:DNA invertase Pin-like site-specific DNA recombinase